MIATNMSVIQLMFMENDAASWWWEIYGVCISIFETSNGELEYISTVVLIGVPI